MYRKVRCLRTLNTFASDISNLVRSDTFACLEPSDHSLVIIHVSVYLILFRMKVLDFLFGSHESAYRGCREDIFIILLLCCSA